MNKNSLFASASKSKSEGAKNMKTGSRAQKHALQTIGNNAIPVKKSKYSSESASEKLAEENAKVKFQLKIEREMVSVLKKNLVGKDKRIHNLVNERSAFIDRAKSMEKERDDAKANESAAIERVKSMEKERDDAKANESAAIERVKSMENERDRAKANEVNMQEKLEIVIQDKEDLHRELQEALKYKAADQKMKEMKEAYENKLKEAYEKVKRIIMNIKHCVGKCDQIREIGPKT
jgi:hypothetical protein